MINISFCVTLKGIKYFREKLNKKISLNLCLKDARKKHKELSSLWNKAYYDINQLIEIFFGKVECNIHTEIYPEYFFLGAINTDKGIIVLGQPSRSPSFYLGLLLHEIVHFLLRYKGINRFIEETICFFFERMFILNCDGLDIDDFEYDKGGDEFHREAIVYSKTFFNQFILFYNNRDIDGLINFLNKNIDSRNKSINITNSLTTYLLENG